jgi:hypothetical protein
MQLDLTDEEALALLNMLVETIEADKFPLSRCGSRSFAPSSPSSDRWARRPHRLRGRRHRKSATRDGRRVVGCGERGEVIPGSVSASPGSRVLTKRWCVKLKRSFRDDLSNLRANP